MEFTPDPRHARVARAAVAAAATLVNFSVDRIDDVRLVVDEVFNALVASGASEVSLALEVARSDIALTARGRGSEIVPEGFDLLGVLGDAIVPGWALERGRDGLTFTATIHAVPD